MITLRNKKKMQLNYIKYPVNNTVRILYKFVILLCLAYIQLLAAHEQELEHLADRLDHERQRQQIALREKLAENRKRKMAQLRRKQETELTKEMLEQKSELDEVKSKKVCLIFKFKSETF